MSDLSERAESGPAGCASDLQLDRLLAGELDAQDRAELEAHLARCSACSTRAAELARQARQLASETPDFATLAARVQQRRAASARAYSRTRAAATGFGLALAAALGLAFVPRALDPAGQPTRSKGKPELGYFLKRGETVIEGRPGAALRPGDRIRFVTSSEQPRYLAVLNEDGKGVSVYYPSTPDAAHVPAGSGVPLAFSVELDDYVGRERVVALFCERPFAVEPVRAALQANGSLSVPAGCSQATLELHKEPAP